MLLNKDGGYVYDYSVISPQANSLIMSKGYKNYGVNILEDGKLNKNITELKTIQTRVNINWNLLKNLSWKTTFYYNGSKTNTQNFYDQNSSYVRQLVDQYGEYSNNGYINYYIPFGNIMQNNNRRSTEWNLRSALNYNKKFGKHQIDVNLGGGGAGTSSLQPVSSTMYGYNTHTKTGVPIFLPTPDQQASINNFYSLFSGYNSTSTPYPLTIPINGDSSRSRNLNWNADFTYWNRR